MAEIDRYLVIGTPIKHSKSPKIHTLFAKETSENLFYDLEEVNPDDFVAFVDYFFSSGGKGLNCTVPLKELAYKFVGNNLSPEASLAKAVNTLELRNDGSIWGHNTDGIGLVTDLVINHQINLSNKLILILGAGGATRGIIAPLMAENPVEMVIANRTVDKAVNLASEFQFLDSELHGCGFADLKNRQFDVILNATSASLAGDLPPLPNNILAENGVCYDLAYGNEPTAFVRWGVENHAAKSLDGLGMLVEQAAAAFYLWRGVRPNTQPVIELLNSERKA